MRIGPNPNGNRQKMDTREIIDKIFKDPKTKYFMKSFVPFASGKEEIQVFAENGKSSPEEIVRQLWVYKLIHTYGYQADEIELEKSVYFGSKEGTKAADIIVYTDNSKQTPKIIIEVKKPKRKDGIEQLKSYLNAEGSPVGLWSNGSERIILYRPYPKDFEDTLYELPKRGQEPKDVLEARKTLGHLKRNFNFKKIIQDIEELVLADSGKDEFNEIFKLIFAKIWDEKEADEKRKDKTVEFSKALDPEITYDRINNLFQKACKEWPGIFRDGENIELTKRHLQICIGPIEGIRLMGSNLRIMEFCYPAADNASRELRMHKYASKYLWGIDFEERAAKTSRALMLIAGDGHTNIFGPDVSSLDPKTWHETLSGQTLMQELIKAKLLIRKIAREDEGNILMDEDLSWKYFDELAFDVVLPQGKFNNSSLAFIRECILRKARLLAVVGLHPNTFKPHTGTKTSVLFVQKYTEAQLANIENVKNSVAASCPDYREQIAVLLRNNIYETDIPEQEIPEVILEIILENFSEPDPDMADSGEDSSDFGMAAEGAPSLEDQIEQANEKIADLHKELLAAKTRQMDFDSDLEALKGKTDQEIKRISDSWNETTAALNKILKPIKDRLKSETKALKESQKEPRKKTAALIHSLETALAQAEYEKKLLSFKGKLSLILEDDDMIGTLKERWIDAEVARQLDYPIFMAVSERGGKNNSGDYEYRVDENGNLLEDESGQFVIDQDLVNYALKSEDLADAESLPEDRLCVAEAFVRFARKHGLEFWRAD